MFRTLHWEINQGIAWLVLKQPPSNRMNRLFFAELKALVSEVIPAADFSALIIHGQGRHFSAGADIDDLLSGVKEDGNPEAMGGTEVPAFLRDNNQSFVYFQTLKVPVIAAIHGVCLGSALELAMFCHFRICAEGALLALPEVSFNLMPGCGGTQNFTHLAGRTASLETLLEGKNMNATEALSTGIVDKVVPGKMLFDTCKQLALSLSVNYDKDLRDYYLRRMLTQYDHERK